MSYSAPCTGTNPAVLIATPSYKAASVDNSRATNFIATILSQRCSRDPSAADEHRWRWSGIYTSIPLHRKILDHPDFVAGRLDTGFLARTGLAGGDKK